MNNVAQAGIITKPLMIEAEGKGAIKLQPKDYVVSGGEGAIYKPTNDTIIKLYHDREKMRKDGMHQKIQLLAKISSPFIVNPKGLVYEGQAPIGYWMKYETGESLAKVITSAYRQRENFTDKDAIVLVEAMRDAVMTAHSHEAILVDANELNWLVESGKGKATKPKLLDLDSCKIAQWDASVIMASIRDWHTKGFDKGSDWFSWAVVTFQLFSGIHPFKGTLDGFKMNDMESRMKASKSVFTSGVKLNSAVRDFNTATPPALLDWYEAVFQQNERSMPPSLLTVTNKTPRAALVRRAAAVSTGGTVVLDRIFDGGILSFPIYVFPCGVVRLSNDQLVNLNTMAPYQKKVEGMTCEIIATDQGLLMAEIMLDGKLSFTLLSRDGSHVSVQSSIAGNRLIRYQNRLFVAGQNGLTEVSVKMFAKPQLVNVQTWQYMYNSTNWFSGVGVQDALGTMFLIAPFSDRSCEYVRTPELNGLKIINAVAGVRYIALISMDSKTGTYKRHEFVFDANYKSYTYKSTDTSSPELNVALLPTGVIAYIPDDGQLVIEAPTSNARTEVTDSKLSSSFTMFNWEKRVVYIDDSKVWSVSLKS